VGMRWILVPDIPLLRKFTTGLAKGSARWASYAWPLKGVQPSMGARKSLIKALSDLLVNSID
jgi:hypothetical protein